MKKILIVTNNQFGYLIDTLKYCEYLGSSYEIEVISCDNNLPKVVVDNIKVHYLSAKNKYVKRIEFNKLVMKVAEQIRPDVIFIDYFVGCSVIKLLLGKKYVYNLDIRTGAIRKNKFKRQLINSILRFEANRFSNISIISRGLQKKLRIGSYRTHYLPLGADINLVKDISTTKEDFRKTIRLVYVGTLFERNIDQTILGIKAYMDKYFKDDFKIIYDIIGYSSNPSDEELIKQHISDLKLSHIVNFHGRLEYKKAIEFVGKSDIGISYIPITEYFDFQPPTKTFEYLLSGIPCLATKTFENCQIINKANGVLTEDTPEDFCEGLHKILRNIQNYKPNEIVDTVREFTWKNITANNLAPYIEKLSKPNTSQKI